MKTRDELMDLVRRDPVGLVDITMALQEENERFRQRLALNSRNSSKPPSTDAHRKPCPKSQRRRSGKKSGGQKGHTGHTLKWREKPDRIVNHKLTQCPCGCGERLTDRNLLRTDERQVFDLPTLRLEVTEHRLGIYLCPRTGREVHADWPPEALAPTSYGPRFTALQVYLNVQQMLPVERISSLCEDLFGQGVSQATILSAVEKAAKVLIPFQRAVIREILQSPVVNTDESSLRIANILYWLHVICTDKFTWYGVHPCRGGEALADFGILPNYRGRLIHDCWASYLTLPCEHGLCNGHILRELTFVHEELRQEWAGRLHALLLEMKVFVAGYDRRYRGMPPEEYAQWRRRYLNIVRDGWRENPLPVEPEIEKKRGRRKRTKAQNLLGRLDKYSHWVLAFLSDFRVPFTNNQAERDIRMIKVKQKVSGCFRKFSGAQRFCVVRSYISTVRKHGRPVLDALEETIRETPFIPATSQMT